MGRRKLKKKHWYLNDDFNEVQEAIDMGVHLPAAIKGKGKHMIIHGTGSNGNGGGGAGFHFGGSQSTYKPCGHDGSKLVYEKDGKAIYGSSWQGLKEYSGNWNLIIDLASNIKPPVSSAFGGFIKAHTTKHFTKALDKYVKKFIPQVIPSDVLCLDWPDMGIPPIEYDFWVTLWDILPAKTVIACMGGHGRTGTCMTALLIVDGLDYWTALETVRKEHCHKAVESQKQEEYLFGVYQEYLNRELALATFENRDNDVADLKEDIKYAEENKPTSKTTTATKHYGNNGTNNAWISGTSYKVQPNEQDLTSLVLNQVNYIKECLDQGCAMFRCNIASHQYWIEPKDSLYTNGRMGAGT